MPISSTDGPKKTTLLQRSDAFRPAFPTTANRLKAIDPTVNRSTAHALTACVLVHPRLPALFTAFLALKRQHGTPIEKATYNDAGIKTWENLAKRLIRKRPVVFFMSDDLTLLRGEDGEKSHPRSRHADWLKVGTEDEAADLRMQDYLTYDEMALSALLGVSTRTLFINSGGRQNRAVPAAAQAHEEEGVYIGLVGARYEVAERMEWAYTIGGGQDGGDPHMRGLWDDFFGMPLPPPSPLVDGHALNHTRYKQRIQITLDTLFLEAQRRAEAARKRAYVVVVGFGLGVWAFDKNQQTHWFVEAAMDALCELKLPSVGVVDFSHILQPPALAASANAKACSGGGNVLDNGIRIKFSTREPAARLTGEDEGMLLVSSFAWDGNAYVGNEYWSGSLCGSGDPAAVCCSTLGELLNPEINIDFADRLVVL
ncbi:hypothetical protein HDU86_007886 [Geranomyces michiganensis]|nr:hypothetical protein HDU86_007886 [Geranomyces michiganensis]